MVGGGAGLGQQPIGKQIWGGAQLLHVGCGGVLEPGHKSTYCGAGALVVVGGGLGAGQHDDIDGTHT